MSINWIAILEYFVRGFTFGMGLAFAFFVVLLLIQWVKA